MTKNVSQKAGGCSIGFMDTKKLNKLTMYLAVEGICDASNTVWQTLQALPTLTPT